MHKHQQMIWTCVQRLNINNTTYGTCFSWTADNRFIVLFYNNMIISLSAFLRCALDLKVQRRYTKTQANDWLKRWWMEWFIFWVSLQTFMRLIDLDTRMDSSVTSKPIRSQSSTFHTVLTTLMRRCGSSLQFNLNLRSEFCEMWTERLGGKNIHINKPELTYWINLWNHTFKWMQL